MQPFLVYNRTEQNREKTEEKLVSRKEEKR